MKTSLFILFKGTVCLIRKRQVRVLRSQQKQSLLLVNEHFTEKRNEVIDVFLQTLVRKTIFLTIVLITTGTICLMAQPSIQNVATQTSTWGAQVRIILTWLLSLAAAAGGVVIAFKLFSGKPDAREGIMMWVGGVLFCAAVALAINLL